MNPSPLSNCSCSTNPLPRITIRFAILLLLMFGLAPLVRADNVGEVATSYRTVTNISYRGTSASSEYMQKRCRLDLYHPENKTDFATVIWFHGGGLTSGNRKIPAPLKNQGIAVVSVNYRLSPKVKSPVWIEDAAAAVAWTINQISNYGGSPKKIFVSGHSAGGYLTSMVGLDKRWLGAHNLDADLLAGLIPFSGHAITHFTVRSEMGLRNKQPLIDRLAPLFHVRGDAPPMMLITGDRDLELLGRYEENAYFWRMMKVNGHPQIILHELDGHNHGEMVEPAHRLLLGFIRTSVEKLP
ncbi:MAG: alpha/beta hydrolase [Mariniblastus sp.]|nr:alpha/beta hydrolase [Mariniblastus sp.]